MFSDIILPQYVSCIIDMLTGSSYEAYAVGGCVRDALMGKEPHDYDITTSALPEEVKGIFSDKYRVIETGIKHGTVTVISDGHPIEITTYRIDGEYKDNRRPESVKFSGNLADDLGRRDFTVNALVYSDKSGIIDLFGGIGDLENRVLRCIGNPHDRFCEDALRILRALRFSSQLDFDIDKNTADAIHGLKELLKNISAERIREELIKFFGSEYPERVYEILTDYKDVFSYVIPHLSSVDEYEKISRSVSKISDRDLRLIYFSHVTGNAGDVLRRLRFSNADISRAIGASAALNKACGVSDYISAKHFVKEHGYASSFDAANIISFVTGRDELLGYIRRIKENNECVSLKDLAISGNDILNIGIKDASDIGKALDTLLCGVIDGKFENERSSLEIAYREMNY